jgi:hypothetical protein
MLTIRLSAELDAFNKECLALDVKGDAIFSEWCDLSQRKILLDSLKRYPPLLVRLIDRVAE